MLSFSRKAFKWKSSKRVPRTFNSNEKAIEIVSNRSKPQFCFGLKERKTEQQKRYEFFIVNHDLFDFVGGKRFVQKRFLVLEKKESLIAKSFPRRSMKLQISLH